MLPYKSDIPIFLIIILCLFPSTLCLRQNKNLVKATVEPPTGYIAVYELSNLISANIEVKQDDLFIIRLKGNPSTGFYWYIENFVELNKNLLSPLNVDESGSTQEFIPEDPTLEGGPGNFEFRFLPQARGNTVNLKFIYKDIANRYPEEESKRIDVNINII
jgi:predicted secreted protein